MVCNVGNLIAVVGMCQTDILLLRACMMGASTCGIVFNLMQPKPLWVPASWGLFFITGHCMMIGLLLRERSAVFLSSDELDAYEEGFQRHGFTPRQFKKLLDASRWERHPPKTKLAEEGRPMESVYYFHRGSAQVLVHDQVVGEVSSKARFLGKLYFGPTAAVEEAEKTSASQKEGSSTGMKRGWNVTAITTQQCEVLRWNIEELKQIMEDPNIQAAAALASIADLSSKLSGHWKTVEDATNLEAYRAMLKGVLADGQVATLERRELKRFRETRGITWATHVELLYEVGWTEGEYEDGSRQVNSLPACEEDASLHSGALGLAKRVVDSIALGSPNWRSRPAASPQCAATPDALALSGTSSKASSSCESTKLKELAQTSFHEHVIRSEKDVLVAFVAYYCPPCKALEEDLQKLCEVLDAKGCSNVAVYKMDKAQSNIPHSVASQIKSVPSVWLFRNGSKEAPIWYESQGPENRTVQHFLDFLERQGVCPVRAQ